MTLSTEVTKNELPVKSRTHPVNFQGGDCNYHRAGAKLKKTQEYRACPILKSAAQKSSADASYVPSIPLRPKVQRSIPEPH